jgi:hypothetical protein
MMASPYPAAFRLFEIMLPRPKPSAESRSYAFEDRRTQYSIIRIKKADKEVWAEVSGANNGQYSVHVVEKELMKQAELRFTAFILIPTNPT